MATLMEVMIFGKPLFLYIGILGFAFLVMVAASGFGLLKGKVKLSVHKWLAITLIIIAIVHAILGIAAYF